MARGSVAVAVTLETHLQTHQKLTGQTKSSVRLVADLVLSAEDRERPAANGAWSTARGRSKTTTRRARNLPHLERPHRRAVHVAA